MKSEGPIPRVMKRDVPAKRPVMSTEKFRASRTTVFVLKIDTVGYNLKQTEQQPGWTGVVKTGRPDPYSV